MNGSLGWSTEAVMRHRPYLYRYALSRVRHQGAAEDIVQETLLAAVKGQGGFRGDSTLLTWLTGILKHKIVDWQRREARNPGGTVGTACGDHEPDYEESHDMLFDSEGHWVKPPSAWPDPEQCFENKKFWEMLERCLASLPQATARAFYLREIEGLQTAEICAELRISESNCWVMLHRARMSLRQMLEERWFDKGESPTRTARKPARIRTATRSPGHASVAQ